MSVATPRSFPGEQEWNSGSLLGRLRPTSGFGLQSMLFALAVSSTLYVSLFLLFGKELRPVQAVPVLLAVVVLPFVWSPRLSLTHALLIAPLVWATYMVARHAGTGSDGLQTAMRSVINVVVYLTVIKLASRTQNMNGLMAGLACGMLISFAAAAGDVSIGGVEPRQGDWRWRGLLPGCNRFGNLAAITFLIGLACMMTGGRAGGRKAAGLFVTVTSAIGIAMSGSRGTLLATVPALLLYLALWNRAHGRPLVSLRAMLIGGILLGAAAGSFLAFESYLPDRIVQIVKAPDDAYSDFQADSRRQIFAIALDFWLQRPLLGSGAEAEMFYMILPGGEFMERSSHNLYLYLLSTSGLIGCLLYLAAPLQTVHRLFHAVRFSAVSQEHSEQAALMLSLMLLVFTHGAVIDVAQTVHVWILFGMATHIVLVREAAVRLRRRKALQFRQREKQLYGSDGAPAVPEPAFPAVSAGEST